MAKKKQHKPNQEYEIPKIGNADKHMLGLDPGSRNFGISMVGVRGDKPIVFANSVLTNPINDLVRFTETGKRYLEEIDRWIDAKRPNGIVGERFQTRGNGGPLIEQVSIMLGSLQVYDIPIKLTVASAWKNKVRRRFDIDLRDVYPDIDVQPHQLDAALIGIFGLEAGLNRDLDYTIDDVIKQCEMTSLIPLKKRRASK